MKRAWLYLMASALASAVSATGCAPEKETARSPARAQAAAQSVFVDLGNGLIYDETLNVTWLQDANYAQTSGYDADGLMTFDEADSWATTLVFGGAGGWRLPTFDPSNPRPPAATSENEIGSLLGALTGGAFSFPSPPDTSPFFNLLGGPVEPIYWTGRAGDPGFVWDYHMTCGWWDQRSVGNGAYAWAVHDGPVAPALSCVGFEPPMASGPVAVKNHRVLPLKVQLHDADGVAVGVGIGVPPVLRVLYDPGTGSPVDVTDSALAAGRGTGSPPFSFDYADGWQFNLATRNYAAPGTYHVSVESGDRTRYAISPTCEATFVIE